MTGRTNTIALVTGAGDGIGRALALRLAEHHTVLAVDILEKTAIDVAQQICSEGGEAEAFACDISDRQGVQALAECVHHEHGVLTQLWAHAGVGLAGGLIGAREKNLDWLLSVNVSGTLNTLRAFVPEMLARPGERHVVVTASSASLRSVEAPLAAYGASKHMSMGIAEGLRGELAESHVGVSVLCPGLTNTRIWNAGRARPERFGGPATVHAEVGKRWEEHGMSAESVAKEAILAVDARRFYIIVPVEGTRSGFEERNRDIDQAFPDRLSR